MKLSEHFLARKPSAIRLAQIEFMKRMDKVTAIQTAIGNVSLPMHPAMQKRLEHLSDGPFADGVNKYTPTAGEKEANAAFLNIIASSGFDTSGLYSQITDGGSQAMELVILGCCGPAGSEEKPLLVIDPTYTNYTLFAERLGRKVVSVSRTLQEDGTFTLPSMQEIESVIETHNPGALVVIPYDNPTGQFYTMEQMITFAKLCVDNDMWMISDEAYRELHYVDEDVSSVWGITNDDVEGVEGRRISIESSSKVWNACGLRIGALVTDNKKFNEQAVAENTASLSPNAIGQYLFGALAHVTHEKLQNWYTLQRTYYKNMMIDMTTTLKSLMPEIILSHPDASIYSVIDVRNIQQDFDALDFVLYCAQKGAVDFDGELYTLLVSPMDGFYNASSAGKT